jgi:glucokinase
MPAFSIGVDLGGTNLRIAAVSHEGELLEKIALGTNLALGSDHVIAEMCDSIQHLSAKYKNTGEFLGVGIGVPGIVDIQTGVMRKAANLPGWENYPARAEIERRLRSSNGNRDARVVLENDARVAALGEQWIGAARGIPNVAMLTLGTGIGGCIILDGKIWRGLNGMAGEFGHITVEPQGHPCGCGNRGCAEQYASASSLMRMVREVIAGGNAPSLASAASSDPDFGARSIYNLALQGDDHARRIFAAFGRYLGILLADLVNVLNPDMFVIGGGVSSAWDAFAPKMFEELRERSIVYSAAALRQELTRQPPLAVQAERSSGAAENCADRQTIITRAVLGSDAGLFGAARLAQSSN